MRYPWDSILLEIGNLYLPELWEWSARADIHRRLSLENQFLCAALGVLGRLCYEALGGKTHSYEVGLAGALLSLLTKIDDQWIDNRAFHRGMKTPRALLEEKTWLYLFPTLSAIEKGRTDSSEPRCEIGAKLGEWLWALDPEGERRKQVIEWIKQGWKTQVRSVSVFTRHPQETDLETVSAVTSDISGCWLLMISSIGMLPSDASRPLSKEETKLFFEWGLHIQRADALCDFQKDIEEGLISTYAGYLIFQKIPREYPRIALSAYRLIQEYGIDFQCIPEESELQRLEDRMTGLGNIASLFRWIHGFLLFRYLCKAGLGSKDFPGYRAFDPQSYLAYINGVSSFVQKWEKKGKGKPCSEV